MYSPNHLPYKSVHIAFCVPPQHTYKWEIKNKVVSGPSPPSRWSEILNYSIILIPNHLPTQLSACLPGIIPIYEKRPHHLANRWKLRFWWGHNHPHLATHCAHWCCCAFLRWVPGGGGVKLEFMKQKPQINSVGWQHTRVDTTKQRFCSNASHHRGGGVEWTILLTFFHWLKTGVGS